MPTQLWAEAYHRVDRYLPVQHEVWITRRTCGPAIRGAADAMLSSLYVAFTEMSRLSGRYGLGRSDGTLQLQIVT